MVTMIPRARVLATVRGERADRVPVYHLQFSGEAASVILGRPDVCVGGAHLQWLEMQALWRGAEAHAEFDARCERDAVAVSEACEHDILRLHYWRWGLRPVERIDERTFLFQEPGGARYTMTYHPEMELLTRRGVQGGAPRKAESGAIDPEPDHEAALRRMDEEERLAEADPPDADSLAWLRTAIEKYPDYLVRHGGGTVMVDMGSAAELVAAAYWPEIAARTLMARAKRLAKELSAMAAAGLEINFSGADFCSAQGPCISPGLFRDVVLPALKLLVKACHASGMLYFYSSDGNFWPVADAMFEEAGVDGWLETDRSAGMELRALRERLPRVTFQGNIRVQVLHRGTRDEVVREVMDCLEVAHELGGVIVGASNLIMPGTPPENIEAMLETIRDNR